MKQILFFIGLVAVLVGVHFYMNPTTVAISVLGDITSKEAQVLKKPDWIVTLFELDAKPRTGAIFSYSVIKDHRFISPNSATIKEQPFFTYSERKRAIEIDDFSESIEAIIDSVSIDNSGRAKSVIFRSIVDEIARLNTIKADDKKLIILSDLLENSSLSTYDNEVELLISENPEKIKSELLKIAKPEQVNGIEVYLAFDPSDFNQGVKYEAVASIISELLTDVGCRVYLGRPQAQNYRTANFSKK